MTVPRNYHRVGKLFLALALLSMACALIPKAVCAQTDEIQVYDAEIEELGKFNVMVHNNFTPIGRKTPGFPGGIIPNHSDNGAVEWAYGVADWFEQGLYFPVYTAYSPGPRRHPERIQNPRTLRTPARPRPHLLLRR